MKKGIFWCTDVEQGALIVVAVPYDADGNADPVTEFSAKSGCNFNHQAEWQKLGRKVTGGLPFNHYPRGRVEVKNGKVTIFLNPDLTAPAVLASVKTAFELTDTALPVAIKADGSAHYQYENGKDVER